MLPSRKAQAAMEFLTTYGWMFMIVIIVFAALAYFGLTDLRSNVPDSCRFDSSFECHAFVAHEDGSYAFEISNIDGRRINLINIVCGFSYTEEIVRYNYSDGPFSPGESRTYLCDAADTGAATSDLAQKDLYTVQIVYTYIEQEPFPKVSRGEIVATANDDDVLLSGYETSAALNPPTLVFSFTP